MQLVAGDHNIVKQKRTRSSRLQKKRTNMNVSQLHQTSEEFCVKLDLLKENIDVASVRHNVEEKQPIQKQAMTLAAVGLTLEEKKCSQLDRKIGFVNKCQIEHHEVPSGVILYRRPFSCLLERDQLSKENTSDKTKAVNM